MQINTSQLTLPLQADKAARRCYLPVVLAQLTADVPTCANCHRKGWIDLLHYKL